MFQVTIMQRGRTAPLLGTLRGPEVCIGRGEDVDLALLDPGVSRRHCRLLTAQGCVLVSDLRSKNGTFVNGVRLSSPRELAPDDLLQISHYRLALRWVPDEPPPRRSGGADPRQAPPRSAGARPTLQQQAVASPWEVLGVKPKASAAEVRSAYLKRIRQYHPDLVAGLGPDLVALAELRTRELNAAWDVLRTGAH